MGLGMPEVILILVIALIVFGPRKLPELGRSMGQAMAQFRRASDDFKRTWEQEVELEKVAPTSAAIGTGASSYNSTSHYSQYGSEYGPEYASNAHSYGYEPEVQGGQGADHTAAGDGSKPAVASAGTNADSAEGVPASSPTPAPATAAKSSADDRHWI